MLTSSIELLSTQQLGTLLRELRKQMGVTQEQAAQLCNVGPRFIGELERGKSTAEIGKVLQVLRGYGLKITLQSRGLD